MGLKNLSIKTKLTLLSGIFLVGMAVVGLVAFIVVGEVKIGGSLYSGIIQGNAINSDFDQPQGHLVGPRLTLFRMIAAADEHDAQKLRSLEPQFEKEQQQYEDINHKYLTNLPDGSLKDAMRKAYEPGDEYLDTARDKLVPLLLEGKIDEAKVVRDQMAAMCDAHDAASKALGALNDQQLAAIEKLADQTVASRTLTLIVAALLAIGLVLALSVFIAKGIIIPLQATMEVLEQVSQGNLTHQMKIAGTDEISQMGRALNDMIKKLSAAMSGIGANATALTAQSEALTATGQRLGANSNQTSNQAAAVSAAAEQVSQSVQTVSTATEEMSTSIREISKNASEAAEVASSAARLAGATTATMTKLSESSAEIGNVIKVITSIAGQTNLLALNATIEAARAGEAGKGFAVVANEVKELAKETARATEDIGAKVQAIQNDAKGAVEAIDEITTVIGRINDIQNTIASAVEEQTGVTNEIARNIAETVTGSSEIAGNISGVSKAATETQETALSSQRAADELSELATRLNGVVSQFKLDSVAGSNGVARAH